jgi:CubicO group peptidase (beta-lactamase class C family)
MRRSTFTRRRFLAASGGILACGSTLAASRGDDDRAPDRRKSDVITQVAPKQSEDGVEFHREIHVSADLMKGFPPPRENRVTIDNWHQSYAHLRWLQLNTSSILRSVPVGRGDGPTWVLPRFKMDPGRIDRAKVLWGFPETDAKEISVSEWLRQTETNAFLVLHDGHIISEQYFGEMTPQTRHLLFSGSKSVFATVVASSLAKGTLSTKTQVQEYVSEFRHSAFSGATVRQLLDMQTGIRYRAFPPPRELNRMAPAEQKEWVFASPEMRRANHEFARNARAENIFRKLPDEPSDFGVYDFLFSLERDHPHGSYFYYAEPNLLALQLALERSTKTPYLTHLGELVGQLGFEQEPLILVDDVGTPVSNIGLQVTARDWARWAQMLCANGRVGGGHVLPGMKAMLDDIVESPSPEKWTTETPHFGILPERTGYRSYFWTTPVVQKRTPIPWAFGAAQQLCYIDRPRKNVVIKLASFLDFANYQKDIVAIQSFVEHTLPGLLDSL